MADPAFFPRPAPRRLADLARICGARVAPRADPDHLVADVAPLGQAGPRDISFLDNRKYLPAFRRSRAGACLVAPGHAAHAPPGMALLLTARPYRAYAQVATALYPGEQPARPGAGGDDRPGDIHAAAHVDPGAVSGPGCRIGPGAVLEAGVRLAEGVVVGPGAVIQAGVSIGAGSRIGANASLSHCRIGARAHIHPGVRIGQRGFGFDMSPEGHLDIPQLGRVLIGDDVEIGANSTVDRGAGPDTVIGDGCKIDNLVQIAHNVRLGRGCVIVAHAGISGSTVLGDLVVVAGQAGIAGHLDIGAGTRILGQAGVMNDLPPRSTVMGSPAVPLRDFVRGTSTLAKLAGRSRNRKDK